MDKGLGASMHLEKHSLITLDGATMIVPCVLLKFFRGISKRVKMKRTTRVKDIGELDGQPLNFDFRRSTRTSGQRSWTSATPS